MDIVTHEICRYHEELQERSFFQLQNPRTTQKKMGKVSMKFVGSDNI